MSTPWDQPHYGGWPFGEGQAWAYFVCRPSRTRENENEVALLEGVVTLACHFGANEVLRKSGQYGPRVEVPESADVQTRLLAFIGRQP